MDGVISESVLEVANYVAHFRESDLEESGFSLLNLDQYDDFQQGKHSFLSVVCTFLMNVRLGGRVRVQTADPSSHDYDDVESPTGTNGIGRVGGPCLMIVGPFS